MTLNQNFITAVSELVSTQSPSAVEMKIVPRTYELTQCARSARARRPAAAAAPDQTDAAAVDPSPAAPVQSTSSSPSTTAVAAADAHSSLVPICRVRVDSP